MMLGRLYVSEYLVQHLCAAERAGLVDFLQLLGVSSRCCFAGLGRGKLGHNIAAVLDACLQCCVWQGVRRVVGQWLIRMSNQEQKMPVNRNMLPSKAACISAGLVAWVCTQQCMQAQGLCTTGLLMATFGVTCVPWHVVRAAGCSCTRRGAHTICWQTWLWQNLLLCTVLLPCLL